MSDQREVTQAEFDKITCSGCGDCCERFYLPRQSADEIDDGGDEKTRVWLQHVHPTGEHVPADIDGVARYVFSCDLFKREDADHGYCTAYEQRPDVCSQFPYGAGVHGFPRCTWNVVIRPDDIPLDVIS